MTSPFYNLILLALLILPSSLLAQKSELGNWLIYFGDKKINRNWNLHHEVQYRNFNMLGDTEQLLLRTGIGYNLTENNNNLLLGYAFIYSEPYIIGTENKIKINEHRIYQQYITRQTFGRFLLQHRYRFEQRFFEDDFNVRFRYFISINININKKLADARVFYASFYNEIFMNNNRNYFDRNRLYGGIGYRFSKLFRSEIGMMNQSTNNISRNQLNLITFLNF